MKIIIFFFIVILLFGTLSFPTYRILAKEDQTLTEGVFDFSSDQCPIFIYLTYRCQEQKKGNIPNRYVFSNNVEKKFLFFKKFPEDNKISFLIIIVKETITIKNSGLKILKIRCWAEEVNIGESLDFREILKERGGNLKSEDMFLISKTYGFQNEEFDSLHISLREDKCWQIKNGSYDSEKYPIFWIDVPYSFNQ